MDDGKKERHKKWRPVRQTVEDVYGEVITYGEGMINIEVVNDDDDDDDNKSPGE